MKKEKMEEKNNNNRTKWIHLRLSPNEYQKIQSEFNKSTCRKISEYIRKHLLNKPITINHRNQSLDEFMWEMIRLRNELNSIGNNLNQSVKKLNSLQQIAEFKDWIIHHESKNNILFKKIEEINTFIGKMGKKWLDS